MGGDWGNEPTWWDCLAVFAFQQVSLWTIAWLIFAL